MPRLKNMRHERFCREYIRNGFNGAKAARAVGCTVNSSNVQGAKWLANSNILQRVIELNDDINDDIIMSAEELLAEASAMARANIKDCYDEDGVLIHPSQLDESVTVNIHEVQHVGANVTHVKFGKDKSRAMDLLAKKHNLFGDHQQAGASTFYMDEKDGDC